MMKQDAHVCVSFDVADESEVAGTGVADVGVDGDGAACVSGDVIWQLWAGNGGAVRPELGGECSEDGHGEDVDGEGRRVENNEGSAQETRRGV